MDTKKIPHKHSRPVKDYNFAQDLYEPRVGFSLRKEVFFVTLGSILGGITMHLPRILLDVTGDSQYYISLLVNASIVNSTARGWICTPHICGNQYWNNNGCIFAQGYEIC